MFISEKLVIHFRFVFCDDLLSMTHIFGHFLNLGSHSNSTEGDMTTTLGGKYKTTTPCGNGQELISVLTARPLGQESHKQIALDKVGVCTDLRSVWLDKHSATLR